MFDHMDLRLQLLGALATLALAIVSAATPILVRAAVRYLERKLKIEVSAAQEAALERAAVQAVEFAEEQARKQLREHGIQAPPSEKLDLARAFIAAALERQGHELEPGSGTEAAITAAIEAAVHAQRTRPKEPPVEIIVDHDVKP